MLYRLVAWILLISISILLWVIVVQMFMGAYMSMFYSFLLILLFALGIAAIEYYSKFRR